MKRRFVSVLTALVLLFCACESTVTEPESTSFTPAADALPTPIVTPTDAPEIPDEPSRAETLLTSMTLKEKVCQLFIMEVDQILGKPMTSADDEFLHLLEEYPFGGLVFFQNNIVSEAQITDFNRSVQENARIPLFLALDEEGGRVSRLKGITETPPSMSGISTADEAFGAGKNLARLCASYGFNLNFAPVADVWTNPQNKVIGDRAFSTNAQEAAVLVAACVRGFREENVLCTLKHFPGHGDTKEDSHYGLAVSDKTLDQLRECEFLPFASGIQAGAPCVMVGHIALPRVTGSNTPASMSKEILDILRLELGFDGLIITDSLQMDAVAKQYAPYEAAVSALRAGADMLLMPVETYNLVDRLCENAEKDPALLARIDESVLRILHIKLTSKEF